MSIIVRSDGVIIADGRVATTRPCATCGTSPALPLRAETRDGRTEWLCWTCRVREQDARNPPRDVEDL